MGDYLRSLELLLQRDDRIYLPAHGAAIADPKPFVRSFIEHRQQREQQILDCLRQGKQLIAGMVPVMYAALPAFMHPAAARSVFAHVLHMLERGMLEHDGDQAALTARYRLKP
jgi:glyoxylase-like metal-dependent hydrolase (beta-lactamase superfamily II)